MLLKSMQAWVGELVGTFSFVTIVCASIILTTGQLANTGLVGVAIAHAFGLGAVITAFAAISGSHFNPAVTLAAWIGRKISSADALGYVAAQIFGALGAGVFLRVAFEEGTWRASNLGTPALAVSTGRGLLLEAVLTFFLIMVIWGTGIDERGPKVGGFAIGAVVGAMILGFGPLTGVGVNPARFLGPAAVAGSVTDWWVYILGPAIGGAAAGVLYPTLFWGGWPFARIGGSPDEAPDTVSPTRPSMVQEEPEEELFTRPVARRTATKRKPPPRNR